MNTELLEKVRRLSPEKQQELEDLVDSLLQKEGKSEKQHREEIAEKRRKNFGNMKGQFWMADDFNETPEDFKDYM